MPAISVIVPVYKVEPYLQRCVDSILAQTYTDFELILVDDGTPDGSGGICDEFAISDGRLIVIHKPNGGVSRARNCGLDMAQGDYITFVDSDDYAITTYLQGLMTSSADLVCQTAVIIQEKDNTENRNHLSETFISSHNRNDVCLLLLNGSFNWTSCKRFRRQLVCFNDIKFNPDVDFGEDTLFTVEYVKVAHSICVEDIANYCYVIYEKRQTLSNSLHKNRINMIKKANQLISHVVSDGESDLEKTIFSKRMVDPFCDFIREYIYKDSYFLKFRGGLSCLQLAGDDDFLAVLRFANLELLPESLKREIENRNAVKILIIYYYIYFCRCIYRLKRWIKS